MKRKRHSRAHILARMQEVNADLAAGVPPDQVCLKHQITLQTLRRWLRQFGGGGGGGATDDEDAAPRVQLLENENKRLRRAVASLELEKKVLAEAVQGNF